MKDKELVIEFASYCLDRDKDDLEQLFLSFLAAKKEDRKDYEILSLISTVNSEIVSYENGGSSYKPLHFSSYRDKNHWLGAFLKSNCWKIYSVKRLIDGEVFTVNEVVSLKNGWNKGKIDGIKLTESNEIYLHSREGGFGQVLKNIFKVKQPLFTTQDGFEIYGGETIYPVSDDFILLRTDCAEEKDKTVRAFAKKENAEKYIADNKPRFSLKDVEKALNIHDSLMLGNMRKSVINILNENK